VIPDKDLEIIRDVRSNEVFVHRYGRDFRKIPPETKVFYDALFKGFRDLLKPEIVVEDVLGYRYAFSSSTVVDGKEVSLVMIDEYNPYLNKWYIYDILAITCGNWCSIYSFRAKNYRSNLFLANAVPGDLANDFLRYILSSKEIQKRAKEMAMEELTKKHEWKILPA
jgi:hypothetical protein